MSGLCPQVLSFTHPVSFHSAETFESLLGCLKMDDEKVAEAALQIFKNTGGKLEESFPHIKSYVRCLFLFTFSKLMKTLSTNFFKLLFKNLLCLYLFSGCLLMIFFFFFSAELWNVCPCAFETRFIVKLFFFFLNTRSSIMQMLFYFFASRILLPVLQHKAKKGPPRQAKYAIRCIHAMFSNRDTHFAQIFEVRFLKAVIY